jgi:hypothetical protein
MMCRFPRVYASHQTRENPMRCKDRVHVLLCRERICEEIQTAKDTCVVPIAQYASRSNPKSREQSSRACSSTSPFLPARTECRSAQLSDLLRMR